MSVLIKGMEMPKNCAWCRFLQSTDPIHKRELFCGIDTTNNIHDYKPNKGCPLVPVPPHGRLIDADALAETHRTMAYANGGRSYSFHTTAKAWVNEAPTVIEAEEDE